MNKPTEALMKKLHIEALKRLLEKRRKEVPLATEKQKREIVFDE